MLWERERDQLQGSMLKLWGIVFIKELKLECNCWLEHHDWIFLHGFDLYLASSELCKYRVRTIHIPGSRMLPSHLSRDSTPDFDLHPLPYLKQLQWKDHQSFKRIKKKTLWHFFFSLFTKEIPKDELTLGIPEQWHGNSVLKKVDPWGPGR